MLLRNLWEWFRITTLNSYYIQNNGNWMYGNRTSMIDVTGTNHPYFICWRVGYSFALSQTYLQPFFEAANRPLNPTSIRVGNGDTEFTPEDYDVENPVTSLVTSFASCTKQNSEGRMILVVTWTGFNKTAEPITINQLGICHGFPLIDSDGCNVSTLNSSTAAGEYIRQVMIAKCKFKSPLVIAPGDTESVTVELEV